MKNSLFAILFLFTISAQAENAAFLTASHSSGAGFVGVTPGVELLMDSRYVRAEVAAQSIEKVDGGVGTILSATVALVGPQGIYGGVRVARMDVERYGRQDIWLVLGWKFIRVEIESETQYLEFRPTIELRRFRVRPHIGYVSGRGADGFSLGVAAGVAW